MKYLFFLLIITLSYGFLHGAIVFESKDERGQLWQVDACAEASGKRSVRISRDGKTVSTFPGGGIASNVHGDLMKEPSPIKDFFVGEENLWIVSRHQADFSELRKVNLNSGKCEIVEIPRVGHELMIPVFPLSDYRKHFRTILTIGTNFCFRQIIPGWTFPREFFIRSKIPRLIRTA